MRSLSGQQSNNTLTCAYLISVIDNAKTALLVFQMQLTSLPVQVKVPRNAWGIYLVRGSF